MTRRQRRGKELRSPTKQSLRSVAVFLAVIALALLMAAGVAVDGGPQDNGAAKGQPPRRVRSPSGRPSHRPGRFPHQGATVVSAVMTTISGTFEMGADADEGSHPSTLGISRSSRT
jgi:hypothetical protein